jgi:formate dehydrogenase subunit delta
MSELDQLIKMANQIAANFRFHDDPVTPLADHLRRFWAPSMRRMLQQHIEQGGAGLDDEVLEAAKRLAAS